MSMIIAHNLSAMNTQRNLYTSNRGLSKSMEKLSSGYRINVGADGPADLVISEQLRAQQFGLERAVRNTTESNNVLNIAEGALNEMNNILKRMKALAIHAANSGITSPQQVAADQAEMDSSIQTLDRIAGTTKYSDQQLLNGAKQLTFEQNTTIKGTQQNRLINNSASAFDQIFRKKDYSVGITFNGTKNADEKTWMGEADLAKQASKAYMEIDTAVGTKSHVSTNGNLTEENQFILTGTKGSRNFKFDVGTHVGEIVQQIHTTSASTGVDAALVFNSAQTVDVCTGSQQVIAYPDFKGTNIAIASDVYGTAAQTIIEGLATKTSAGVPVAGTVSLTINSSAWTADSQLLMSQTTQGDDLGNLNNYRFRFSGSGDNLMVDVYYNTGNGKSGVTDTDNWGDGEKLGSISLGNNPAASHSITAAELGGHLEGVKITLTPSGTPGATDVLDLTNLQPARDLTASIPDIGFNNGTMLTRSFIDNATVAFDVDGSITGNTGSGIQVTDGSGAVATSVEFDDTNTTITYDESKLPGVAMDYGTGNFQLRLFNDGTKQGVALWDSANSSWVDGTYSALQSTSGGTASTNNITGIEFTVASGAFAGTVLTFDAAFAAPASGTAVTDLTGLANGTPISDARAIAVAGNPVNFNLIKTADTTPIFSADDLLAALTDNAKALFGEGTNKVELKFMEFDLTPGGDKEKCVAVYVNGVIRGASSLAGDATGNFAAGTFLGNIGATVAGQSLSSISNLLDGLSFAQDSDLAGMGWTNLPNWESALKDKTILSFEVTVAPTQTPSNPIIDFTLTATPSARTKIVPGNIVGNAVDSSGGARALGEFNIFGNQDKAVKGASTLGNAGIQGVQFGRNTDGQGRIYIKYTSANSYELYKDASLSRESMVASGVSGREITEVNNSGLSGLVLTLDPTVADDLSQLKGTYIAVGGIEGENGAYYGANVNSSNLAGTGNEKTASFDKTKTFLSGVALGINTDASGQIYTRTVVMGKDANNNELIQITAFRDSNCRAEDMVAQSEVVAVGKNGATILLNEVRNRDNTSGTGLAIALSCNGQSFLDLEKGATFSGSIGFTNLAARVFSSEYGSDAFVKIEQHRGGIFTYYENQADFDSSRLIEATETNPVTRQLDGQDATLSVNGSQVRTHGLQLNLATQDIQARLQFYGGLAGTTTIAQVGYGEGSIFTKIGALNLTSDIDWNNDRTKPKDDARFANLSGLLCNAGHITMENIGNWRNGMTLQLGEGEGDQERTVLSIENMAVANMGKIQRTGYWETGSSVQTEKTFTMQDVMGGGLASLMVDPILAMSIIEQAINDVSDLRARLGAAQTNLLETNANNLRVAIENIAKTESNIRDTDMASEMTDFTKNQILQSAGMSMLAQANSAQQSVLQLLQ